MYACEQIMEEALASIQEAWQEILDEKLHRSIVGQQDAVPRRPSIFVLFDFWSPKMNRALK